MILAHRAVVLAAVVLAIAPMTARAVGAPAGTLIESAAQVSYTIGGASATATSNTASVVVAEMLDVVLTLANATVTTQAGALQQELVYTLSNTGNGAELFQLTALSAGVAGDDFDPVLGTPAIWFDVDDSADLSPADVPYAPGTNDPVLAADATIRILVVNDIPAGVLDAQRGRSELTVRAATGTGAPGTLFPGAGAGEGGVDAIVGATGAQATLAGEYLIAGLTLTAVKSQAIVDPFGGSRPLPGARINYQIVVNVSGAGVVTGAVLADPVPPYTTYVAGSLALNGTALTDDADADAGQIITTPALEVRVTLGDLTSSSGPQTIEFAVTID